VCSENKTIKSKALMSRSRKSSSGDGHHYLKGYRFWSQNQFWNTDYHTDKAREYFHKSLEVMQAKDRVLARLDNTIL
jgi:hypothetical protein